MKQLLIGKEAVKNAVEALSTIAEAVGSTLGPQGRPFVFERLGADQRYKPTVSKDGLTALNSLEFSDPIYNAVHYFAQQAAAHSVLASGDGTTSTIVLAAAVAKAVIESGHTIPQAFARQLRQEAFNAVEAIKSESDTSPECSRMVALTSANGDEELTDCAIEAIGKSSAFGTILVEKSPGSKQRFKIIKSDGYVAGKGYNYNNVFASSCSSLATENSPFEWENAKICVLNGHLYVNDIVDAILAAFNKDINENGSKKLVIFTYEVSDEVLNRLIVFNRKMAPFDIAVYVAKPKITAEINSGLQIWRDICAYSAATMLDGGNYKAVEPSMFGAVGKVRVTPTQTILLGRDKNHWVEQRVQQNKNIIDTAESQFDKEITAIRNGELAEGLVKVEVGGGLLPDIQERADRLDDAVKAAQACMRSGALPGCGASYIRAGQISAACKELSQALSTVHKKIMENYGATPLSSFDAAMTCKISDSGCVVGNFREIGVVDASETVQAVIKNGVELGILVATLGGYSLINLSTMDEIQKARTVREVV
jgi:chaperonin GroEL (HSP60 family)